MDISEAHKNTLHIIALSRLAPPAKILDMGAGAGETVGLLRDMATTPGA